MLNIKPASNQRNYNGVLRDIVDYEKMQATKVGKKGWLSLDEVKN